MVEFVEFLHGKFKPTQITPLVETIIVSDDLEAKLERGRARLLQLGEGLGGGKPPHDVADNHDQYLYSKDVIRNESL